MDIQETAPPGVGLRHEFTTRTGRQLGVVSYLPADATCCCMTATTPTPARR
jgi:hypothetical protein